MSASSPAAHTDEQALMIEGCLIGVYILGEPACEAALHRYVAGCRALFATGEHGEQGAQLVRFVARYPWALAPLDAAAGLLEPQGALRKRLLVMLAILEATPEHAESFLPRERGSDGVAASIGRLFVWGATSLLKLAAGFVLYPFARLAG